MHDDLTRALNRIKKLHAEQQHKLIIEEAVMNAVEGPTVAAAVWATRRLALTYRFGWRHVDAVREIGEGPWRTAKRWMGDTELDRFDWVWGRNHGKYRLRYPPTIITVIEAGEPVEYVFWTTRTEAFERRQAEQPKEPPTLDLTPA